MGSKKQRYCAGGEQNPAGQPPALATPASINQRTDGQIRENITDPRYKKDCTD
ncbi:hypothetical protein GCM10027567_33320 [Spongiibacter taiwanensis]